MCLPKFDIYQYAVASNCFMRTTLDVLNFIFLKKVFSDARSEIHPVRRNIVFTGQSASS